LRTREKPKKKPKQLLQPRKREILLLLVNTVVYQIV